MEVCGKAIPDHIAPLINRNIKEGEQITFDLHILRDKAEIVIASDMIASQKDAETTDADDDREDVSEMFRKLSDQKC